MLAPMTQSSSFDADEFRKALGAFATGVTIITTCDGHGAPVGLTANSFNSVSLNPPLVLWSLSLTSSSLAAFRDARHWAVHVLAADQQALSMRFARRGEDRFAGLPIERGVDGVPLLKGCAARFVCRTAFEYRGGDHLIFVGEVLEFTRLEAPPLVFHGGRYADPGLLQAAAPRTGLKASKNFLEGSFDESFLGHLLARSHHRFFASMRAELDGEGLSEEAFDLLSTITLRHDLSSRELSASLTDALDQAGGRALRTLIDKQLVLALPAPEPASSGTDVVYELTPKGQACALRIIAAAKAAETQLLDKLGDVDGAELRRLLGRLLELSDMPPA